MARHSYDRETDVDTDEQLANARPGDEFVGRVAEEDDEEETGAEARRPEDDSR